MLRRLNTEKRSLSSTDASFQVFLVGLLIVTIQLSMLHAMGRPLVCPCGTIQFWQGELDPLHNSQQFTDWYSFLHGTFGLLMFTWLAAIRPHWSLGRISLITLASSAVWEVVENLPPVVARFGSEGNDLHYVGDSLINSVGDTLFVMIGLAVATRISMLTAILLAIAIEGVVYWAIGDSILVGLARFIFK